MFDYLRFTTTYLYQAEREDVAFKLGALNVLEGDSKTENRFLSEEVKSKDLYTFR